jgi:type IV secretion system protein VirD4
VLYAAPDKTLAGAANFLSDPKRPIETTLRAMMTTPHLGEAGVYPVVASAARELLNKGTSGRACWPPPCRLASIGIPWWRP